MKALLTKLFSPILNLFENADGEFHYSPSHRKILLVVGLLFFAISGVSAYFGFAINEVAAALPAAIFFAGGLVCVVVALLGSDKAVSKVWTNRR